jgi:hypothetical protein
MPASSGEFALNHCSVISEPEVVVAGDSCSWMENPLVDRDDMKLPTPEMQ